MKKRIALLLCMVMLMGLCACGAKAEETTPPTAAPTTQVKTPEENAQKTQTPKTTEPAQTEAAQDMVEVVRQYIDKPIEDLYKVIGQPLSSDYASSCLGDGEDGLLVYDGFVVYTYREGDVETVYDVE